jgi:putative nucleotidyltransferase with HDIG domain
VQLDFTDTLYALSFALDAIESEHNGVRSGHGKRVALISELMGREAGMSRTELIDLVGLSVLHDNALVEFVQSVNGLAQGVTSGAYPDLQRGHCELGEQRIKLLPFLTDTRDAVRYHHERADGTGPYGKQPEEVPLAARIIHLADQVDVHFAFLKLDQASYGTIAAYVHEGEGTAFSHDVVELFDRACTLEAFDAFLTDGADACLRRDVPTGSREFSEEEIENLVVFFTEIVDTKSSFTRDHSVGVARKARAMARHYGWDDGKVLRYYFAGAFHDIGKVIISNDILEKPGRLTGEEFGVMKNHAAATYRVLSQIDGLEDVTEWAANHHEKLDGSGYSRGLDADRLTFEDRLMACIDIYQALSETRPYKEGLAHRKAIGIMRDMARLGKIDAGIVGDLDRVFGADSPSESEKPEAAREGAKRWRCRICGFVYEGEMPPQRCPVCDLSASFELME